MFIYSPLKDIDNQKMSANWSANSAVKNNHKTWYFQDNQQLKLNCYRYIHQIPQKKLKPTWTYKILMNNGLHVFWLSFDKMIFFERQLVCASPLRMLSTRTF